MKRRGSNNSLSVEYNTWQQMKGRCYNPTNQRFKYYGGRGIKVCKRWLNSFENFIEDMGLRPSGRYSLDRYPNRNGDYKPSNCRWATYPEQNRNLPRNIWIKYNGINQIQKDWAKHLKIASNTIKYHRRMGRSFEWIYLHFKNGV